MNIELARTIARAAFRSTRELGALMPLIKEKLPGEEYVVYSKAIASAIAGIQLDIVNKLTAEHPGLEAEIEKSIEKTGRYS
jgi:hypothetical protein